MSGERFQFLREPKLAAVLALLNPPGEETRVVGGAVRAALLGRTPADVDLATTMLPQEVMDAAAADGIKAVPTGVAHGTVTLVVERQPYEVTTLREDIATDGRHAKVRFGRNFIADALRRDFTMNALSVSADGRLHDYVGGQADLAARRVRFIGNAAQRIAEDYLRSLRFFRFHASFGAGEPDGEAMQAIIASRAGLLTLSRERIGAELLKLLAAHGAPAMARAMSDCGIATLLLGGITYPARLARVMAPGGQSVDAILNLAALTVEVVEDAARLGERLRLSSAERQRLAGAAAVRCAWHGRAEPPLLEDLQGLLLLHGREATQDGLRLAEAAYPHTYGKSHPGWAATWARLADLPQPRLPFSGADLQRHGIASGPAMGAMLKSLQASWIRAGFPRDPAVLAQLLDSVLARK